MSEITITLILLGGGLSIIFILFAVIPYLRSQAPATQKWKSKETNPLIRKAAGMFALSVGLIMLGAWLYFLIERREAFISHISAIILHVILMFFSSVALIFAGVAMIRHWHRSAGLFYGALAISNFSIIVSLLQYGTQGHPFLMNGIAIVVLIVLTYFVGGIYAFEHFVLHLDEEENGEESSERRSA